MHFFRNFESHVWFQEGRSTDSARLSGNFEEQLAVSYNVFLNNYGIRLNKSNQSNQIIKIVRAELQSGPSWRPCDWSLTQFL